MRRRRMHPAGSAGGRGDGLQRPRPPVPVSSQYHRRPGFGAAGLGTDRGAGGRRRAGDTEQRALSRRRVGCGLHGPGFPVPAHRNGHLPDCWLGDDPVADRRARCRRRAGHSVQLAGLGARHRGRLDTPGLPIPVFSQGAHLIAAVHPDRDAVIRARTGDPRQHAAAVLRRVRRVLHAPGLAVPAQRGGRHLMGVIDAADGGARCGGGARHSGQLVLREIASHWPGSR